MSIEEKKAEVLALDRQIRDLQAKRSVLKREIAEALAICKVGDFVTYAGTKFVWQVVSIEPGYGDTPKYFGQKLKKDGTPGVQVSEIWLPFKATLQVLAKAEGAPNV